MASLQDQFLKVGLVDKKKVKLANQEKAQQLKVERRSGTQSVDEARQAALDIQRRNAERARELNAQRDAVATEKAIWAQIVQMVQQSRQDKGRGDIAYNFTHDNRIRKIQVSPQVRDDLVAGRLVVVCLKPDTADLVPRVIADKIAERNPAVVVQVTRSSTKPEADDPYADFKVPDDLMW